MCCECHQLLAEIVMVKMQHCIQRKRGFTASPWMINLTLMLKIFSGLSAINSTTTQWSPLSSKISSLPLTAQMDTSSELDFSRQTHVTRIGFTASSSYATSLERSAWYKSPLPPLPPSVSFLPSSLARLHRVPVCSGLTLFCAALFVQCKCPICERCGTKCVPRQAPSRLELGHDTRRCAPSVPQARERGQVD